MAETTKKAGWYVHIVESETGEIVEQMGPMSERRAAKVQRGANINLNHDSYHTDLVEVAEMALREAPVDDEVDFICPSDGTEFVGKTGETDACPRCGARGLAV